MEKDPNNEPLDLSERVRRKIWGTDQPPGRIDPYDPESPIRLSEEAEADLAKEKGWKEDVELQSAEREALVRRRRAEKEVRAREAEIDEEVERERAREGGASSIEGLAWVGGVGWRERIEGDVVGVER